MSENSHLSGRDSASLLKFYLITVLLHSIFTHKVTHQLLVIIPEFPDMFHISGTDTIIKIKYC